MISRIEVWHRGHAIPLRLFETSDTNSSDHWRTLVATIRSGRSGFPFAAIIFRDTMPAMPIRHYLQGHRFDAKTARLMGIAYEMALVALQHADGSRRPNPRRGRTKDNRASESRGARPGATL